MCPIRCTAGIRGWKRWRARPNALRRRRNRLYDCVSCEAWRPTDPNLSPLQMMMIDRNLCKILSGSLRALTLHVLHVASRPPRAPSSSIGGLSQNPSESKTWGLIMIRGLFGVILGAAHEARAAPACARVPASRAICVTIGVGPRRTRRSRFARAGRWRRVIIRVDNVA